jgi:transcriptional regulator with XRE-family HTH domain
MAAGSKDRHSMQNLKPTLDDGESVHHSRKSLAHHVKRLRQERGWSQLQLAQACGLHRTHVSRLENAAYNASINTVDQIAIALGVAPPALLEAGVAFIARKSDTRDPIAGDAELIADPV